MFWPGGGGRGQREGLLKGRVVGSGERGEHQEAPELMGKAPPNSAGGFPLTKREDAEGCD